MNISGDLSVSEFKPQQSIRNFPKMGETTGKGSFLDLMKILQGSAQKGLEETLTEIQSKSSQTEPPQSEEEDPEIIKEKKTRSINSIEEDIPEETVKEEEKIEETTNEIILPWFLVSESKTNEIVDPEIESVILDELQSEIIKTNLTETLKAPESISTSELIENFFANEVEEGAELLSEVSLIEESENLIDIEKGSLISFESSKEIKPRSTKQENEIYEKVESFEAKDSADTFRFNELDKKESKENVKGFSNSFKEKDIEEAKIEISKELALDSEKWKISRDKKTDSYTNLKAAAKEEIKAVVLNQFAENSSGKSGQEQSFRSDSYSSLVKGVGTTTANSSRGFGKEFFLSKESNVLSKKDIQQNFQNLIRSARVQILENGRTEASIRMNPKDLGQMSLAISTDKDVVRGKLLVESDTVKQQLVAELANLKQDLKANGLELESLIIEVKEREEVFSFNTDSDKNGKDSHSFQAAFGEDWNSDFKNSFYEEDELPLEENFSEPNDFSKKTDGKSEKLLDLKV